MKPIQVIVIDDSAFMRRMISDILESDQRIKVIATCRNGEEGTQKIKLLSPDVVTLDVEMPIMDGITTLKKIMAEHPLPVVMLSNVTKEGASKTFQAISFGAVDFIPKPSGAISLDIDQIKTEIIAKVLAASRVKMEDSIHDTVKETTGFHQINKKPYPTLVAIGTSTGGPRALQTVLTSLPEDYTAPILIVQHMPQGFTKSLADRLNTLVQIQVKEAVHGEIIQEKTAYIAPGNYHMKIRQAGTSFAIELTQEAPLHSHRPSVDVLFHSMAQLQDVNKLAVVLTGMGNDGAEGIKKIREIDSQAIIIAEAEDTAVIYGMPKAAIQTGAVNLVVPLPQIGKTISKLIN